MSMQTLKYKDYIGIVSINFEDNMLIVDVQGVDDTIVATGSTATELKASFKQAIDEYLEFCKEVNKSPDKPYSGKFPVRTSPEVHRNAALAAMSEGISLNAWVEKSIQHCLNPAGHCETCDTKGCAKVAMDLILYAGLDKAEKFSSQSENLGRWSKNPERNTMRSN